MSRSQAVQEVEELQFAPAPRHGREVQFGDLILTFTTQYQRRWLDNGSGAKEDVGFWHPIPPAGFFVFGSIGLPNHTDPNNRYASLCAKKAVDPTPVGRK